MYNPESTLTMLYILCTPLLTSFPINQYDSGYQHACTSRGENSVDPDQKSAHLDLHCFQKQGISRFRFGTSKMHLSPPPPPPSGFGCCQFYGSGSVIVDSLFIVARFCVWSSFCYAVLYVRVLSSFAILLMRRRELVALL